MLICMTLIFRGPIKCFIKNQRKYSSKRKPTVQELCDVPIENIRNFSIIAHVDHGKSTLADRILEYTGAIKLNSGISQVLDKLQVERERGITVKAQSTSMLYKYNNEDFLLNLIDTPGHVDFSNEVRQILTCHIITVIRKTIY